MVRMAGMVVNITGMYNSSKYQKLLMIAVIQKTINFLNWPLLQMLPESLREIEITCCAVRKKSKKRCCAAIV